MFRVKLRSSIYFASFCLVIVFIVLMQHDIRWIIHYQENLYCNCSKTQSGAFWREAVSPLRCNADGGKFMQCYYDGNDVYFPFERFLKNRFAVSGKIVKDDEKQKSHFEWYTSSARMKIPNTSTYDFSGPFGQFAFYSVETRDRVRCISAKNGVPMSTQWSPEPYFYPVQIAQFALQHYSRFKTNAAPVSLTLGEDANQWKLDSDSNIIKLHDTIRHEFYMHVTSKVDNYGIRVKLSSLISMVVVTFQWKASPKASFAVTVQLPQTGLIYELRYVQAEDSRCVWSGKNNKVFFYSLGETTYSEKWQAVNRNFLVDLDRALLAVSRNRKSSPLLRPGDVEGLWISFSGDSFVKNIRQRSSSNLDNFLVAAKWFLSNQNDNGGWSVPIARSIANNQLFLSSGWHSAMAQGHAMSVLIRAYDLLNDTIYLEAAGKALAIFEMTAAAGGVSNDLFGHPWYEEYPTIPGTYVLNGFMYSLIGLYDFSQVPSNFASKARSLFDKGITSLKMFLALYDTGSGSIYDLRHFTLKTAPNIARWDYHAVHIYLLKWLYGITDIKYFDEVADRWIGYSRGRRAKHN